MKINNSLKFIISILLCLAAGFIGSLFTTPSISSWYPSLIKPFFNPPNWIFAPVWTALFILMGVSLFLVWKKGFKKIQSKKALAFFSIQLVLNILWSVLFFGLHSPLSALICIILLWIAILLTIITFYKLSRTSAYLMIPYILWVSFASVLNIAIVALN